MSGNSRSISITPTLAAVPLDPATARELTLTGKKSREWLARRDAAIRKAHGEGGGLREIARLVGLSHGAIHTMLFGRKR